MDEWTVVNVDVADAPGEFLVVRDRILPDTELIEYDSPDVDVLEVVVPKEVYPGRLEVTEVPPPDPELDVPLDDVDEAVVELRFGLLCDEETEPLSDVANVVPMFELELV